MGSQLYRCLAPIQPWLSYLLDGYTGPPKVLGVFFSAAYMVCKGPDIVTKMKCFQGAIVKFVNSVVRGKQFYLSISSTILILHTLYKMEYA